MQKWIAGFALGLFAGGSFAQSVIAFDVTFDKVYEASGSFTPNITVIRPGPFSPGTPQGGIVNLTGRVVLSAVPSGTELTNAGGAVNTITLNGSFSTESGFSPSNGWSVHSFDNATFDLYKPASFFATDFVTDPDDWPIFTATAANGRLSDHGPASIYPGGTCPYFFGCASAQSAGSPNGTQAFDLFDAGTPVFAGGVAVFAPGFRNSGNYPLIAGSATQTNPGSGLGFDNGLDAFAIQGVLDVNNSQGNGSSQLYPDGVDGRPGIVRILTFSSTGNTLYMVEGRVTYAQVPTPGALWLLASALGVLGARRYRRAGRA